MERGAFSFETQDSTLPPELAPELPEAYDPEGTPSRQTIFAEAKSILANTAQLTCKKVSLRGSGGAGKTTLAAALARDRALLNHFELAAWLTLGEKPDVPQLQRSLLRQLGEAGAAAVADEMLKSKLQQVCAGRTFFVVIDAVQL